MNSLNTLIAAAAASLIALTAVQAQTTTTAPSDTKATGELSVPNQDKGAKPMASQNSREAVKAQAKTARADGTLPSGEKSTRAQGSKPATPQASTKTRAEVRAEGVRARKAGETETGQRSIKDQDKGGIKN